MNDQPSDAVAFFEEAMAVGNVDFVDVSREAWPAGFEGRPECDRHAVVVRSESNKVLIRFLDSRDSALRWMNETAAFVAKLMGGVAVPFQGVQGQGVDGQLEVRLQESKN